MTDIGNMAVQSFCFRAFDDNATVAEKVKEIGLKRIEICAKHVDFADESTFDKAIATYKDAGVEIVSIGVNGFKGDAAEEEKYFRFAQKAGIKLISANFELGSVPDCFRVAETLAEQYDVRLGIHNHGGKHWLGNAQALAWVFGQTSERIGLMLDTAWALDAAQDPVALIGQFSNRLYGVHLKDFTFDRARKHTDVVVGTGNIDLPQVMTALDDAGFNGELVLEYEGNPENPVPALKECVQSMQNCMVAK